MPRASVWLIRTALLKLVAGFGIGAFLLTLKGLRRAAGGALLPLHVELVTTGWLLNLALGMAYSILPKHAAGPERGRAGPVWLAWGLLNAAVLAAAVPAARPAAAAAQLGAVALFAAHMWPRVKAFGAGRGAQG